LKSSRGDLGQPHAIADHEDNVFVTWTTLDVLRGHIIGADDYDEGQCQKL
jgi:hypothetical protein